jgi:glycerophosphoryl diester phosphodiesterase
MNTAHKTLIVAHRGKVSQHQENSLAAIQAAMQDPHCDGVEFDVFLMKDGEVVVFHDEDMERLTGVKQSIYDISAADLSNYALQTSVKVDGGDRNYAQTQPIPLLRDVLRSMKGALNARGKPFFIDIELKAYDINPFNYAVGPAAATIVQELGMFDQCVLSSFNYFMLAAAKAAVPTIKTVIAYDDNMPVSVDNLNHLLENNFIGNLLNVSGAIAEYTLLDQDSISKLKNKQLLSGSFTFYPLNCNANDKAMYDLKLKHLNKQGLHWVETDNIECAYSVIHAQELQ